MELFEPPTDEKTEDYSLLMVMEPGHSKARLQTQTLWTTDLFLLWGDLWKEGL